MDSQGIPARKRKEQHEHIAGIRNVHQQSEIGGKNEAAGCKFM